MEEIQEAKGKKVEMSQGVGDREIQQVGMSTLSNATDLKESPEAGITGTTGDLNLTRLSGM